jgi:hypothetical protein
MSKFDKDTPLPYEKLLKNLEVVKKRYLHEILQDNFSVMNVWKVHT